MQSVIKLSQVSQTSLPVDFLSNNNTRFIDAKLDQYGSRKSSKILIHDSYFSATTEPERTEEEVVGEVAILVVALTTFASDLDLLVTSFLFLLQ